MPNQEESKDGVPRQDATRPTPDVDRNCRGDGPGKAGLTSGEQPDLVSPSDSEAKKP